MTLQEVQTALLQAGFDPGPLDGIAGRRTTRALREFQRSRGLAVDGILGPKTLTALGLVADGAMAVPLSMPWLHEAMRLIGTKERPGKGSSEAILGWAEALGIDYNDDETAWCGLFVAHCVGAQLPDEPLPSKPLLARGWLKFGRSCPPQLGSVLVFWRKSRDDWRGHVGLYWAEDDEAYHVLGGNQDDAVNVTRVPKVRLLDARWPHSAGAPSGRRRRANSHGKLSQNEA